MNKTCTHCRKEFVVTEQDKALLSIFGISDLFTCEECNFIERMIWRNERTFFHHTNKAPSQADEQILSIYNPDSGVVVYDQKSWWSDSWDAKDFGKEYDFSKPFFEQWKDLFYQVPFPNLLNWNSVNSSYCNCTGNCKNCYMCFGGEGSEDSTYCMYDMFCKQMSDVYWAIKCELCYEVVLVENCYKVFYSFNIKDCRDSYFLTDCTNCSDCIGCVGLKNAQYHILNQKYSREDYLKIKEELKLNTQKGLEEFKKKYEELVKKSPKKYARIMSSHNAVGDRISGSKDVDTSFDVVTPAQNIKGCYTAGWNLNDTLRSSQVGFGAEKIYNSFGVFSAAQSVYCSAYCPSSMNVWYSYNCQSGSNLFGCVGMRKGQYCILNKQYTKEEYEDLLPKIIQHMKDMPYIDSHGKVWNFGDFFPSEFSPFSYNESVAIDIYPKSKEEIEYVYTYRERVKNNYQYSFEHEDICKIDKNDQSITSYILPCKNIHNLINCPLAFKITEQELFLYKILDIPLPEACFNCRHFERFQKVNKFNLQSRSCDCNGMSDKENIYQNSGFHLHEENTKCSNVFKTTYKISDHVVYCEDCYKREVL